MIIESEIPAIIKRVQASLDRHRDLEHGIDLRIPEDGWRLDGRWLYITVEPMNPAFSAYHYSETLGLVEKEVRGDPVEDLMLVPNMPY